MLTLSQVRSSKALLICPTKIFPLFFWFGEYSERGIMSFYFHECCSEKAAFRLEQINSLSYYCNRLSKWFTQTAARGSIWDVPVEVRADKWSHTKHRHSPCQMPGHEWWVLATPLTQATLTLELSSTESCLAAGSLGGIFSWPLKPIACCTSSYLLLLQGGMIFPCKSPSP